MTTVPRVAFVTGAARGIGLAIAQWFHARGWCVVIVDIDRDTLARTNHEWVDANDRVLALPCDVSRPDEVAAAVARTDAQFGRIGDRRYGGLLVQRRRNLRQRPGAGGRWRL
jgi:NAD(P)-dependent dehydrogenase (short-subunit alcohol dehydrogenase family)